jgi:hypothetical protein
MAVYHGNRFVESVDAIANAPYTNYGLGQLIVDLTTFKLHVRTTSAWVVVGTQVP